MTKQTPWNIWWHHDLQKHMTMTLIPISQECVKRVANPKERKIWRCHGLMVFALSKPYSKSQVIQPLQSHLHTLDCNEHEQTSWSRNQTNLHNLVCPVAQTTNSTNCTPRALNDMDTCPLPSLISTACGKETQLQIQSHIHADTIQLRICKGCSSRVGTYWNMLNSNSINISEFLSGVKKTTPSTSILKVLSFWNLLIGMASVETWEEQDHEHALPTAPATEVK